MRAAAGPVAPTGLKPGGTGGTPGPREGPSRRWALRPRPFRTAGQSSRTVDRDRPGRDLDARPFRSARRWYSKRGSAAGGRGSEADPPRHARRHRVIVPVGLGALGGRRPPRRSRRPAARRARRSGRSGRGRDTLRPCTTARGGRSRAGHRSSKQGSQGTRMHGLRGRSIPDSSRVLKKGRPLDSTPARSRVIADPGDAPITSYRGDSISTALAQNGSAAVEVGPDPGGGGGAHRRAQLLDRSPPRTPRSEPKRESSFRRLIGPHAGDVVQLRAQRALRRASGGGSRWRSGAPRRARAARAAGPATSAGSAIGSLAAGHEDQLLALGQAGHRLVARAPAPPAPPWPRRAGPCRRR